MKKHRPPLNYLRTERRRWALTQHDVVQFLDFDSRSSISRLERGEVMPDLESALALEVMFGKTPRAMFPQLYERTEDRVMREAKQLYEAIEHSQRPCDRRKRVLLSAALKRAVAPNRL